MTYKLAAIMMAAVLSTASWAQAPVSRVGGSGSVDSRLAELERAFNARGQAQIDQQRQFKSLQNEVSELRGMLEEQNYRLEQVIERQREMLLQQQDAKNNTATSRSSEKGDSSSSADRSDSKKEGAEAKPASGDEQGAYESAVNLVLKDKDHDAAIPAFARFITQYPDSRFVPNAHYWLGQLLYSQQRFDQAKAQFARVVEAYEQSSKRPDALLKLGLIAQEQQDSAQARSYFEQVVSEYGNSGAARLAKEALDNL
ncbi:MAG: tol-pal system protein YbgF [Aeromonadales bacterium]|nr:tol-pal system protein YbgF [Aeromonadales bacterium]